MAYGGSEPELTRFNLALPYLNRINELLGIISVQYRSGDGLGMMWSIKALYHEVAPKLNRKEREDFEKKFAVLNRYSQKSKASYNGQLLTPMQKKALFFRQLERLNILLRDHLEVRGVLMPSATDRRFMTGVE